VWPVQNLRIAWGHTLCPCPTHQICDAVVVEGREQGTDPLHIVRNRCLCHQKPLPRELCPPLCFCATRDGMLRRRAPALGSEVYWCGVAAPAAPPPWQANAQQRNQPARAVVCVAAACRRVMAAVAVLLLALLSVVASPSAAAAAAGSGATGAVPTRCVFVCIHAYATAAGAHTAVVQLAAPPRTHLAMHVRACPAPLQQHARLQGRPCWCLLSSRHMHTPALASWNV
jgi:hypothetical protein